MNLTGESKVGGYFVPHNHPHFREYMYVTCQRFKHMDIAIYFG